jgi:outer membrane protein TolC
MNKKNLMVFCLSLMSFYAIAQEHKRISLKDAINQAQLNNTQIKIAEQNKAISTAQYKQSMAVFLPNVTVDNAVMATNSPLNTFGFKLLQQTTTPADFNPTLLNSPDAITNFSTQIQVQQPLINIDGFHQRKAAKLAKTASEYGLTRTKDGIKLQVQMAYLKLQLSYKAVDVVKQALKTIKANHKYVTDLYKQGLVQKSDVLNLEVYVASVENQLQQTKSMVKNTSDQLAYLLGKQDKTTVLVPTDSLSLIKNILDNKNVMAEQRTDILAYKSQVEAQKQMLKASQSKFLPRANAFANYEWNTADFLGFKANNYLVGVQLSWSVFNGGKHLNKIKQEQATLAKAQLGYNDYVTKTQLDFQKTKRQLNDALANLHRSKLAVSQSAEALKITTNRYKQGLEKTTDLLNAQTQYQSKQLEYYQAILTYNATYNYLKFLQQ